MRRLRPPFLAACFFVACACWVGLRGEFDRAGFYMAAACFWMLVDIREHLGRAS